ncbi:protein of unknown function [Papillibacter cinnamivorans DSM 12816]|uniref:DUF4332 domain-containing protein n=2 Tax=Papillibacter TaxID=100175 RepID=A0A1W1ZM89_9FIRM|nr:protein of unknown function [Papillibacter cinnamivorans DSM 12816]
MPGVPVRMSYTIDLKRISIQVYRGILKNQNLLPGRRSLLNALEERFRRMADAGIGNLFELKNNLSTPQKLSALSAKTKIPEDYLVILKRELSSFDQKPVPISDFPGVNEQTVHRLLEHSIKTSKDFYNMFMAAGGDEAISSKTGVGEIALNELYSLCNLVRINGVGAAAARTLYESGYKNIEEIAHADPGDLLNRISETNSVGHYYNAKLGIKDAQFVIDFAKLLFEFLV